MNWAEWSNQLPPDFQRIFLGLAGWQWLLLGLLLTLAILAKLAVQLLLKRVFLLETLQKYRSTPKASQRARRAAGNLALITVLAGSISQVGLPAQALQFVELLLQIVGIVSSIALILHLWDMVCIGLTSDLGRHSVKAEKLLVPVTRKFVRFLIALGGVLVLLAVLGVNVVGLVAGLGLTGLVVALAAKDSVENIFGSLTILFDMPFALGDWVRIDKVEGVVEQINLRSTKIRTFEDSVITLPNSNLIKASVENFGARRFRRQRFYVRYTYESVLTNIPATCQAIRAYLDEQPNVPFDRTLIELNEMGDTAFGILVQCFFEVDTFAEEAALRSKLLLKVLEISHQHGMVFAGTPRIEPAQAAGNLGP